MWSSLIDFVGIGEFFPKETTSSEVSPEKPGPSVASAHPGVSPEEQQIEGIEKLREDWRICTVMLL